MSLDLSFDYESAKKKIAATSSYKDLKEKSFSAPLVLEVKYS